METQRQPVIPQPSNPVSPQKSKFRLWIILISVSVFVVFGVVRLVMMFVQGERMGSLSQITSTISPTTPISKTISPKQYQPAAMPNIVRKTISQAEITTVKDNVDDYYQIEVRDDPATGLKIYTDNSNGFSFKFPPQFTNLEKFSNNYVFTPKNVDIGDCSSGFTLSVWLNNKKLNSDDFINENKGNVFSRPKEVPIKTKSIDVAGMSGIRVDDLGSGNCGAAGGPALIIAKGDKAIVVKTNSWPTYKEGENIFNQILSTFKFSDQSSNNPTITPNLAAFFPKHIFSAADSPLVTVTAQDFDSWKTYINMKIGYKIQYPASLSINDLATTSLSLPVITPSFEDRGYCVQLSDFKINIFAYEYITGPNRTKLNPNGFRCEGTSTGRFNPMPEGEVLSDYKLSILGKTYTVFDFEWHGEVSGPFSRDFKSFSPSDPLDITLQNGKKIGVHYDLPLEQYNQKKDLIHQVLSTFEEVK